MTKTKRNVGALILFLVALLILILFLYPCGPGEGEHHDAAATGTPAPSRFSFFKKKNVPPEKKAEPATTTTLPHDSAAAVEEVDHAPPVTLNASDEAPNMAKCVHNNFPNDAKAYVKRAVVTIRVIVNKFGTVKSVTPLDVEFATAIDEEQLPLMRKLFIQAGRTAFGKKKCPPHLVNGQSVGYAIEVPLVYKH